MCSLDFRPHTPPPSHPGCCRCWVLDLFLFPSCLHHFLLLLQPYFLQTHAAACECSTNSQRWGHKRHTYKAFRRLTDGAGVDGHVGHGSAQTQLLQSSQFRLCLCSANQMERISETVIYIQVLLIKARLMEQTCELTFLDLFSFLWVRRDDGESFVTETGKEACYFIQSSRTRSFRKLQIVQIYEKKQFSM